MRQWPQHWTNHSIDIDQLMAFLDVEINGVLVTLSGVYGDPIYHADLAALCQAIKRRGARIEIHTNGSYRTTEWWRLLCQGLDAQDRVIFGIDGLPGDFTQYRVNADWVSIEQGIKTCVKQGIPADWRLIPFKFNQDQIEKARKISQDLGMSRFLINASDRFDDHTQHLRPDDRFLGGRWGAQQQFKSDGTATASISPRCHDGTEHYVSADGFYASCCYVADHRFYHKTFWGREKTSFDIRQQALSDILLRPKVIEFFRSLPQDPPAVCQYNCPAVG